MKHLLLFLALFSLAANAGEAHWLKPMPRDLRTELVEVADDRYFEIPASKLSTAEEWLSKLEFMELDIGWATDFGHSDFKCTSPSRTYLIRASYINGGTGRFGLHLTGSTLVVSHAALGDMSPASRSALVACLDQSPTGVYSWTSTAL